MDDSALLEAARAAVARRDWVTARDRYREAQAREALSADDLFALANCAWWLGALDEAYEGERAAYRAYLDEGRPRQAALVALDVAYTWALRGDEAQSSGWMSRATRLLEGEPEGYEHGYLVYLDFESSLAASDLDAALEHARRVHAVGREHGEPNLTAMGVLGQGRVLVKQGHVAEGMALLDEAMVAAVSDELDPSWAGNIYCHLMLACHELGDLRRAGEWTQATASWCESMPGAGPFMGICRVHRAQVLEVQGDWDSAEREATRVTEELAHFHVGIVAEAHYELGNLRRQRGDLEGAEQAFREAHRLGREPQPGLALLRLAQGQPAQASAAIQRALTAAEADPLARARLLPVAVEVALATGDLDAARGACAELDRIARAYGTTGLQAPALHMQGATLLAAGAPEEAIAPLREARRLWQELRAPCETARVRLRLAEAYRALGDADAATLELDAARAEFVQVGALGVLAGLGDRPLPRERRGEPSGLTEREAEVLSMVAEGLTNQEIAAALVLSVRTVERHLATVYQKLGLHGRSARAAAVRYALREGITT